MKTIIQLIAHILIALFFWGGAVLCFGVEATRHNFLVALLWVYAYAGLVYGREAVPWKGIR